MEEVKSAPGDKSKRSLCLSLCNFSRETTREHLQQHIQMRCCFKSVGLKEKITMLFKIHS